MKPKTVLITGAGSGLGKEAAILLAKRGHIVYATVHYETEIKPLLEIAKQEHLKLEVFKLDILKETDRNYLLSYDIDILICNAAIGTSGSVSEIPITQIKEVFETNVFCNIQLIQLVLKQMILNKRVGRIVVVSSLVGRIPIPFLSPYCASKSALESFTTCLRQELKLLSDCSIDVCMIEPGAYATGFNKENIAKKYEWMKTKSYFSSILPSLAYWEEKFWNFIEIKPYTSILRKYCKTVEDNHIRLRYTAPWYQSFFIQFGRIFGK